MPPGLQSGCVWLTGTAATPHSGGQTLRSTWNRAGLPAYGMHQDRHIERNAQRDSSGLLEDGLKPCAASLTTCGQVVVEQDADTDGTGSRSIITARGRRWWRRPAVRRPAAIA